MVFFIVVIIINNITASVLIIIIIEFLNDYSDNMITVTIILIKVKRLLNHPLNSDPLKMLANKPLSAIGPVVNKTFVTDTESRCVNDLDKMYINRYLAGVYD